MGKNQNVGKKVYPERNRRVFVGLSGGVDSAVSAALLKEWGYDVTGVFLQIALEGYPCTAAEDRRDALRVATHLQIPFLHVPASDEYKKRIFEQSVRAYERGETPNPDTLCNREIKFGLLFDFCMGKDADFVATGHYARTQTGGRTHLLAGIDPEKDQSYFLWMVPQERLAKTLFPVGNLHKPQVRKLAQKYALPNADRKDSHGLCFLGPISMDDLLEKELKPVSGVVLDEQGTVIGMHRGAVLYTIGQRHGFRVNAQSTQSEPHYVVAKDIVRNTITVSTHQKPAELQGVHIIALREENWIGEVKDGEYNIRFRYRQKLIPAVLRRSPNRSEVVLKEPHFVPIGQSLVVYEGERCLGGGIIDRVCPIR